MTNQAEDSQYDGLRWLVLVPTQFELNQLEPDVIAGFPDTPKVCGFGSIVAAARTLKLIQLHRPDAVVLMGIAGSYRNEIEVSSTVRFDSVACHGIGVGSGENFVSSQKMGWPQWPGDPTIEKIDDRIVLREKNQTSALVQSDISTGLLLTVMSASANQAEVDEKLSIFPDAVAEDMEGFGVAAACHLESTSLTIIRGISNRAGDRDKGNWRIKEAMNNAGRLVERSIFNKQG